MSTHRRLPRALRNAMSFLAPFLLAVTAAASDPAPAADGTRVPGTFFRVLERATGLSGPVGIANAGDGSNRLFIVQQGGLIRIWNGTQVLPTPFLNLTSIVFTGSEQGLLGLAFHPNYETNGLFYVHFSCRAGQIAECVGNGDTIIARYNVSANDPNVADPASRRVMLWIDQPFSNHNGGHLAFGPDGYLYIAMGDGGSGGDPLEVAQDLNRRAGNQGMLGKMLRIDVNQNLNTAPFYGIPPSNPYIGAADPTDAINDEIWAYGLRNPWRYSFDRLTGDLWVGDVGQSTREEATYLPAPLPAARNFGWDVLEGTFCHENVPQGACTQLLSTSLLPAVEYGRNEGATVIGGYVYRGRPFSLRLSGRYVMGDNSSGNFWRVFRDSQTSPWQREPLFTLSVGVTSFGEDERGGLFFVGAFNGRLYQIVPYSFSDVPLEHPYWRFVEPLFERGVTGGCGGDNYCPDLGTNRAEMSVFLLRTFMGPSYVPPACSNPIFSDVPCSHPFAPWIYDLVTRQVTAGCGGGLYCPESPITREQMAVFLLRTLEGDQYLPPACTSATFSDVPCSSPFARWVEELVRRGITGGCGGGLYCPGGSVTRGQMAVFLVATFGLAPIPPL